MTTASDYIPTGVKLLTWCKNYMMAARCFVCPDRDPRAASPACRLDSMSSRIWVTELPAKLVDSYIRANPILLGV